jgi:hypothetical protein
MFSIFSLSTLVDISQSRLGPHLQFLHIGLDRIGQLEERPTRSGDNNQDAVKRWERLSDLRAEHAGARATGEYHALLTAALRNLPNLEGIMIRDFNSRRRTRDGWNAQWRSYGYQTIENSTGFRPTFPRGNYGSEAFAFPSPSDAFIQVLSACAQAGARPKAIEIMTQSIEATDEAFRIPQSKHALFMPVIEGLQKLHIHYRPRNRPDGGPALPGPTSPDNNSSGNNPFGNSAFETVKPFGSLDYDHFLHRFLCKAVNLTDLRINQTQLNYSHGFGHGGVSLDNPSHYLLKWLAAAASISPSSPSSTPSPITFLPKLKHLSIGRSDVEVGVLSKLVDAFAGRIESLEMHRITLYRPLPQPGHGEKLPKTNLWVSLLRDLQRIELNKLHHIKFAMMNQAYMVAGQMWPKCRVTLEGKANQGLDYTGTDWRKYLEEREDQIKVTWLDAYDNTASMTSESEDDSEGNSDIEM